MSTSWKQLLGKLDKFTKHNGVVAWETAKIVRQLWSDQAFLREGCAGVLDTMTSKLAVYSGRFAFGLNDMLQMIEHFPARKDWEDGRLDLLRDKTARAILKKTSQKKRAKAKRSVITHADYDALKRKYEQLLAKYRQLEKDHRAILRQLQSA